MTPLYQTKGAQSTNQMNKQRLFDTLVQDEGVVYEIYRDHLGYATFGVGHLITRDDPEHGLPVGTPVSEERVWTAFEKDLEKAIRGAESIYESFREWPGEVQEILVNMVFNMGATGLSRFANMRRALEQRDWKQAAIHGRDSLWYRQVPNRAERLMSRLESITH